MYLIPFGQTSKSYSIEPEPDKTAQHQFKNWLKKGLEREDYYEKLKAEIDENKE